MEVTATATAFTEISMSRALTLFVTALVFFTNAPAYAANTSDSEIKRAIIEQSLASYPGPCPCPYNTMRNGRACGGRSAYSKPGGYSPICYESDVSEEMIEQFKGQSSLH